MQRFFAFLSRAGLDSFLLLMIGMVVLAWRFPEAASPDNPVDLRLIGNIGVVFIFFFYGLKLDPAKLFSQLGRWRMHFLIQSTTFVIFPLIILACRSLFYKPEADLLWVGAFYLAAVPSTVSSSVVMVSIAGGNISAAIFNASVSSLIGIFLTPVWMNLFVNSDRLSAGDLTSVIINLCFQVLLPVAAGIALHGKLGFLAVRFKNELRYVDQAIILLIVFRAFCDSFLNNMFDGYSLTELFVLGGLMLLLFFVMLAVMQVLAVRMGFSREDRITVIFCGSKKSMIQGVVMGQILFPDATAFAIVLLPLMLYHALQLFAGSILAQRMARAQT
jgi:solute carrier family 10 (sodium/bile acid cotransporter), member 7